MFKAIFKFINSFFPYKTCNKTNKIYIIEKGIKKELKHKIKGLNIIFTSTAQNSYVELHMPLNFKNSTIKLAGESAKVTIKKTENEINNANFLCYAYGEIFIDEDSRITMPNLVVKVCNNYKENPSKVIIGKSCQIGQNVIIRTSDGHSIFNVGENIPFNAPKDIIIGDNVWIGERVVILKGSKISNNSVIGTCALVNKVFDEENVIIAGLPAKIIKRNIFWKRTHYGDFMSSLNPKSKNINNKEVLIKKLKRKLLKRFI